MSEDFKNESTNLDSIDYSEALSENDPFPPAPKDPLIEAIDRLEVRQTVKEGLYNRLKDLPRGGNYHDANEAIRNRELSRHADDTEIASCVTLVFWALVYYTNQYITYADCLEWLRGRTFSKDSDAVKDFRRNNGKHINKAVNSFGFANIAWVTTKEKVGDPNSVDGFRLTTSGDDYRLMVNDKDAKRLRRATERYIKNHADSRIEPEDVRNPILRDQTVKDKQLAKQLDRSHIVERLKASSEKVKLLAKDNSEEDQTGNDCDTPSRPKK